MTRSLRSALGALALALLLIAGAACGGGDDSAATSATPTPGASEVTATHDGPVSDGSAASTMTNEGGTPEAGATATRAAAGAATGTAAGGSAGSAGGGSNPYGLASADRPNGTVSRLRVPSANIDAQVVTGEIDTRANTMLAPRGAWPVAWYPYSAVPGTGGNAVFSGHVDYINIGLAVFGNLRALRSGDIVQVQMADGRTLTYRVESNRTYSAAGGPWDQLFGARSGNDIVTLYTCDGAFSGGHYAERRVVRAVRVS